MALQPRIQLLFLQGNFYLETCACMSIQGLFAASAATVGTADMSLHFLEFFVFYVV